MRPVNSVRQAALPHTLCAAMLRIGNASRFNLPERAPGFPTMKSAYELAMQRLGGTARQYTAEQKEQLADLDRLYDSRIVQAKFAAQSRRAGAATDAAKLKQIDDDLAVEIRSLEAKRERRKEELRSAFAADGGKP